MVAPENDDGIVLEAGIVQSFQDAADLIVDEASGSQVGADEIDLLIVLGQPFLTRFGQFPVYPPGGARRIVAIAFGHRGKDGFIVWIQIEPLLGSVAWHVRQEEAGGEEKGFSFGHVLDHVDSSGSDVEIALGRVVVIIGPDAPVHERVIAERRGGNELLRRFGTDSAAGSPVWEFGVFDG